MLAMSSRLLWCCGGLNNLILQRKLSCWAVQCWRCRHMLEMSSRHLRRPPHPGSNVAQLHRSMPCDAGILLPTGNHIVDTVCLSTGYDLVHRWCCSMYAMSPGYNCRIGQSSDILGVLPFRPIPGSRVLELYSVPDWCFWKLIWDDRQYLQWAMSRWPIWLSCRNDVIDMHWCLL